MDFFINAAQAQAAGGTGAQGGMFNMLLFIPLFLAFYFLLIRPQNKRAKEQREMVAKLAQETRSRRPAACSAKSSRSATNS